MMVAINSSEASSSCSPYTRDILVLSTYLEIQTKHYPLVFRNRRGNEARIKKTWVFPIINAPAGRILGAYDLGVATPRALVHAGDKTSGDARSWYMISGDAKSWVCFDKGKWMVLENKDVHPWGFEI
ncbi:hypothetical protein Tco_0908191 [Tanacetum coccineum]|uniref:Uncharacterized protein n=1 Tax=Tanacetum coccineum TaxID=301880 RepID=A0ABQ5CPY9_9ASTR